VAHCWCPRRWSTPSPGCPWPPGSRTVERNPTPSPTSCSPPTAGWRHPRLPAVMVPGARSLGRTHSVGSVEERWRRWSGIGTFNLDVIYGGAGELSQGCGRSTPSRSNRPTSAYRSPSSPDTARGRRGLSPRRRRPGHQVRADGRRPGGGSRLVRDLELGPPRPRASRTTCSPGRRATTSVSGAPPLHRQGRLWNVRTSIAGSTCSKRGGCVEAGAGARCPPVLRAPSSRRSRLLPPAARLRPVLIPTTPGRRAHEHLTRQHGSALPDERVAVRADQRPGRRDPAGAVGTVVLGEVPRPRATGGAGSIVRSRGRGRRRWGASVVPVPAPLCGGVARLTATCRGPDRTRGAPGRCRGIGGLGRRRGAGRGGGAGAAGRRFRGGGGGGIRASRSGRRSTSEVL
jgi:hypothetical protein